MDHSFFLIILISLMFSALFSGIEIAFVSSNKLHIELKGKKGSFTGKILSRFTSQPSQFIGTTLIGNTLALVVYGIFMAKILEPVIFETLPDPIKNEVSLLVAQTIISTVIVLITAEFTPKSIFMINPDWMLSVFAVPMFFIYYLLYPIVFIVVRLSRFIIIKIFKLEYSEDKPAFGLTDLNNFIKRLQSQDQEEGNVGVDTKIFHNALEFKTVRIRECMIPRTEISAIDIEDDMEELTKEFVESGHSKIVVYRESIDDVIGYIHSSEMFKKPKNIRSIITPLVIVPETMLASELMIQFITEHKSLALVVDEFGGTSGLVSIEDIIEEIFGEIQDEHDEEDWVEQKLDKNTYLLSARHEIDYLNDKYGWSIPTGDFETISGLILSVIEDLPNPNEEVEIPPYKFTIVSVEDIRINTVKLSIETDLPKEE